MSLRRNARGGDRRLSGLPAFGAGGGLPFTPASIAGLALWLRADSGITTVNGVVTQWVDKSSNGYVFTGQGTAVIAFLGTGSATSTTVTVSEAVNAGDTILVGVAGVTAPTDNAVGGSNAYVAIETALGGTLSVYGCVSAKAASAGALVITGGGASLVTYAHYSGVGSFDTAVSANTGAASNPDPGNVTPTAAGETIVAVTIAATVETAGSGYALRAAGSATAPAWQDKIGAGTGSTSAAFGTSATSWSAAAVTMIPASSPPSFNASDANYNGTPTISFLSANKQRLSVGSLAYTQPITYLAVFEVTNANGSLLDGSSSNYNNLYFGPVVTPQVPRMFAPAPAFDWTSGPNCSTKSAIAALFNAGGSKMWQGTVGSASPLSGSCGGHGVATWSIGGATGGSGDPFMTGKVAEFIAYNTALTNANVAQLFAYFAARYAVTAS